MAPKIDVRSSLAKKTYTGELRFEFEAEEGLLEIPYVAFASPIQAELKFEIFEDNSVEVKGNLCYTLAGLCSRCLAQAKQEIVYEVTGVFVPAKPQDEEYSYSNGRIELDEFLRDSVLFSLPQTLLCAACANEEE